ncbi:hypothetical protein DE146DRAFT_665514 [Phaeosphaeria sp. MPI-PUGE-AT-0046c]|nr:hypothetical protein DE146DRAFT_665514 [Phaeosphaeria sp. MPI-PUGE-AT-0046c]
MMIDIDAVAYSIAVFITALFLLEFGADKFIDHTTIVAHRTGIPQTIVALITAGGEWEELAVVIASLARNRPSLAIGNIIGSAISNILGAFSLGLLFHSRDEPIHFDRSSRVYSLVLLAITTFTVLILYLPATYMWLAHGIILVLLFAIYIASVGWAIARGVLAAPEDSDSDDSDSSNTGSEEDGVDDLRITGGTEPGQGSSDSTESSHDHIGPTTPLLPHRRQNKKRGLQYHVCYLLLGFASICIAGYVLAHAASTIVDEFKIPDMLFGVVILAIATTLPEKFIAVMSGRRGHAGILVANTAGSNIFLLSLCLGIVVLDTKGNLPRGSVGILELGVLWGSTAAFTATIWLGAKLGRWIGGAMILSYIIFILLEFTQVH